MRTRLLICILSIITVSCIILPACDRTGTYYNPTTGKVWSIDSSGNVQTNDFERLQRSTPFTIIVPDYVPDELLSVPVMYTKTVGMNAQNDVDIRFSYTNSTKSIHIEEVNYIYNWIPDERMNPVYFELDSVKVLREDYKRNVPASGQLIEVNVYSYTWNTNGVSFVVDIWDYSEAESRKVIESMIK